ncbi:MAG: hypothetical protein KJN93_00140 [Alphaproteobacteria bacterium]|nr:hypothetical protein [Alphaproteobacteria bacterium]
MRDFVYIVCFIGLLAAIEGFGYTQPGGPTCAVAQSLLSKEDCIRIRPEPASLQNVRPERKRTRALV